LNVGRMSVKPISRSRILIHITIYSLGQSVEKIDPATGAENLRFQGPRQIQIADNLGRSGVPREFHNKTLLVRKVC